MEELVKLQMIESLDKHYRRFTNMLVKSVQALPKSEQKDKLINEVIGYHGRMSIHIARLEWEIIELSQYTASVTRQNEKLKQTIEDMERRAEMQQDVLTNIINAYKRRTK